MSIAQPQILARHDLSIIDIDYLEERLYDHNSRATGLDDGSRLSFLVTDADGTQIGAIAGYRWAGMAESSSSGLMQHTEARVLAKSCLMPLLLKPSSVRRTLRAFPELAERLARLLGW